MIFQALEEESPRRPSDSGKTPKSKTDSGENPGAVNAGAVLLSVTKKPLNSQRQLQPLYTRSGGAGPALPRSPPFPPERLLLI